MYTPVEVDPGVQPSPAWESLKKYHAGTHSSASLCSSIERMSPEEIEKATLKGKINNSNEEMKSYMPGGSFHYCTH